MVSFVCVSFSLSFRKPLERRQPIKSQPTLEKPIVLAVQLAYFVRSFLCALFSPSTRSTDNNFSIDFQIQPPVVATTGRVPVQTASTVTRWSCVILVAMDSFYPHHRSRTPRQKLSVALSSWPIMSRTKSKTIPFLTDDSFSLHPQMIEIY